LDADAGLPVRILHGVAQQVADHLLDAHAVTARPDLRPRLEAQLGAWYCEGHLLDAFLDRSTQIEGPRLDTQPSRLDARDIQHILNEPLHSSHLPADGIRQPPVSISTCGLPQKLGVSLQDGERCSELMRRDREETVSQSQCLLCLMRPLDGLTTLLREHNGEKPDGEQRQ
jgi:hypothetical protein